jgi:pyruvate dehydrogenase E2 component (dihydrolipoamide acetyltransferase)
MDIKVPSIGDFDSVEVIEVLVAAGERVKAEQSLLVLESDKATMEIPSPASGTLTTFSVKVGDKIGQGDVIGTMDAADTADNDEMVSKAEASPAPVEKATEVAPPVVAPEATATPVAAPEPPTPAPDKTLDVIPPLTGRVPHGSPSVRLFARELGVDLGKVVGTGPKERILKQDIQAFVKGQLASGGTSPASGFPSMPVIDFSKFGEVEAQKLPRIRKLSAANLHRNWVIVPHVTQFESADITELEAFRKAESARGEIKLTLLPFVIKAVCLALKAYPEFCSSLAPDGQTLILKKYAHIGFAAETPQGLMVPVIRDADHKSVRELAQEAAALAASARDGKLSPAQMQGGSFSISSLGGIGGSHFTPIVNAPEVAILGVSRGKMEAVWNGQVFHPRLILPLSLSYDHRVIDGAAAARFAILLAELLSDIRRLCL